MTVTNPLNRLARCTWQYDPKEFPTLRGWFCVHTVVPDTGRCYRHPLEGAAVVTGSAT